MRGEGRNGTPTETVSPAMYQQAFRIGFFAAAFFLVSPSHGQIADLNFDESSGHYNAVTALTGDPKKVNDDPTSQVGNVDVKTSVSFNGVSIGESTDPKFKTAIGPYFSDVLVQGRVSRQQADPSSTYTVVPRVVGLITASGTVPTQVAWTAKVTATYTDAFYFTDNGASPRVLGISLTSSELNNESFFPSGAFNESTNTSLTLTFESPSDLLSPVVIEVPFVSSDPEAHQINLEFDQFGPDNLYEMTARLDVTSTFTIPPPVTEPTGSLGVNLTNDVFVDDLIFATIELSDAIDGLPIQQFVPKADAIGPPTDGAIVPSPSAAAAGLALLTLMVSRRPGKQGPD